MKKNLKALEAAVMTSINNNVVPVMKNIDGLLPITKQIVRVSSNFGYAYLGYAYEKLITPDGSGILNLNAIKALVSRQMNLIIDNALKTHGYEEEETTACLSGESIPAEDGNGAITVDMVKDLASDAVVFSAYDNMLKRIGSEYCFETAFTHDYLQHCALTVEKNGLSAVALIDLVKTKEQFTQLYDIITSLGSQLVSLNSYKKKLTEEEEHYVDAICSALEDEYLEGREKLIAAQFERINKEAEDYYFRDCVDRDYIDEMEEGIMRIEMTNADIIYGEVEGYGITLGFTVEDNNGIPGKICWDGGNIVVGAVRKRYLNIFEKEILRMAYDFLREERIKYAQDQLKAIKKDIEDGGEEVPF